MLNQAGLLKMSNPIHHKGLLSRLLPSNHTAILTNVVDENLLDPATLHFTVTGNKLPSVIEDGKLEEVGIYLYLFRPVVAPMNRKVILRSDHICLEAFFYKKTDGFEKTFSDFFSKGISETWTIGQWKSLEVFKRLEKKLYFLLWTKQIPGIIADSVYSASYTPE